jgi:hypothetical protein
MPEGMYLLNSLFKIIILLLLFYTSSNAQFFFFGRNKVQYENFKWKVLNTEHFNIYYYDDFGELAEIGAQIAEEAFDEYKVKFQHYITHKIPLIFYNTHTHFEQTNITSGFIPEGVGGFFEFLKGRVVIPYLGSVEKFRHVIRHELVHVFMVTKLLTQISDYRSSAERLPPLWFVEGLAEYWSTSWDTQSEMIMRDAVLNGIFAPLSNIESIYGSYLMYKEGQKFLEFVSDYYGEDKILAILNNFWKFKKFNELLEFVLDDSLEKIDERWIYEIRKQYFPLYSDRLPHTVGSKKITNFGYNYSPTVYEVNNQKWVYFIGNHTGYTSLMRLNLNYTDDYANAEIIIEGEREKEFESFHPLETSLALSNDGIAAFITKVEGKDVIHLYSIKDEEIINTLRFSSIIRIKSPSFSSDNSRLLFSATDSKGFSDIYYYDFNSKEMVRLTNDYYDDNFPIFFGNDKIIFSSDRTDGLFAKKYNLFELDIPSQTLRYLTNVNANLSTPKLSKNNNELYFTADYDGAFNIYKIPYNGTPSQGMHKVTSFLTSVYGFSFIDDKTIVTSAFEKFSFQFYIINLESHNQTDKFIAFDFSNIGKKWEEKRIVLKSESHRLEYEKEYTLDYAVSQFITDPVYGSRGGAFLSLSDLLGDDRYMLYVFNTAEVQSEIMKNFNIAISRISLKDRTNYGYGVFNYSGRRYDIRESNEFFYERVFGGFFSLYFPFSQFQRIEADFSIANSDKSIIEGFLTRKSLLVSNSLSFVHDNAIWYATGPIDGSRFRVLLGYTSDAKYSNVNYYSFIVDYRKYFRLSLRSTLAARGAIFINDGKESRRYFAGGSWDLRGWPRFSIRGQKLWLSSIELRFPLIDQFTVNFPFFGLGFFNIRGAAYFDAGSAWDTKYRQTIGSMGFGVRLNLFNAIGLRYDIGKKIENNFTQFQNGFYYQFFFGWDF